METPNKKIALIILDGWGLAEDPTLSAIHAAQTPCLDRLFSMYPSSRLEACGEAVGLPPGGEGNSEVGHINIGAGRVVLQEKTIIDEAIRTRTFFENPDVVQMIDGVKRKKSKFHLMGLLTDVGIHAHLDHLKALVQCAVHRGLAKNQIVLHLFSDGRDTKPNHGVAMAKELIDQYGEVCTFATLIGRFYAMDRDQRWQRTESAYRLLVEGVCEREFTNLVDAFEYYYGLQKPITDEFIPPTSLLSSGQKTSITYKDSVFFFNFRPDRMKQLIKVFTNADFGHFKRSSLPSDFGIMSSNDQKFHQVRVAFQKKIVPLTLGEVISKNGLTQLRAAESEKHPHVTYFLNGGLDIQFPGEDRINVPSPKVLTYDLQPEMSIDELVDKVCEMSSDNHYDLIVMNFANPDMVGHTGVWDAAVKAVECTDRAAGRVIDDLQAKGYTVVLIADHGNVDRMKDEDGSPNTAHSLAKVPFLVTDSSLSLKDGKLGDIAPTILHLMGISIPVEMTGNLLV